MKAIRIQLDIIYQVPDDESEAIYNFDVNFFNDIKTQMETWNINEKEPRELVEMSLRHHLGNVETETNEPDQENTPLDGSSST